MKKAVMRNGRGPLINLMVVAKVSATVITCIHVGTFLEKAMGLVVRLVKLVKLVRLVRLLVR